MNLDQLSSCPTAVAEQAAGEHLTGKEGSRSEKNLVVLRPGAHRIDTRLAGPVLELQNAALCPDNEIVLQTRMVAETVQQPQDTVHHKVSTVFPLVDVIQASMQDAVVRASTSSQAGNFIINGFGVCWCRVRLAEIQERQA